MRSALLALLVSCLVPACRSGPAPMVEPPVPPPQERQRHPLPMPRAADCGPVRERARALLTEEAAALARALEEPDLGATAEALPALGPCERLRDGAETPAVTAWAKARGGATVSSSLTGCADTRGAIVEAQAELEGVTFTVVGRLSGARLTPLLEDVYDGAKRTTLVRARGLGDLDGDGQHDVLLAEEVEDPASGESSMRLSVHAGQQRAPVPLTLARGDFAHLLATGARVVVLAGPRDGSALQAWKMTRGRAFLRDEETESALSQRIGPHLEQLAALRRLASLADGAKPARGDVAALGAVTPAMRSCLGDD